MYPCSIRILDWMIKTDAWPRKTYAEIKQRRGKAQREIQTMKPESESQVREPDEDDDNITDKMYK